MNGLLNMYMQRAGELVVNECAGRLKCRRHLSLLSAGDSNCGANRQAAKALDIERATMKRKAASARPRSLSGSAPGLARAAAVRSAAHTHSQFMNGVTFYTWRAGCGGGTATGAPCSERTRMKDRDLRAERIEAHKFGRNIVLSNASRTNYWRQTSQIVYHSSKTIHSNYRFRYDAVWTWS